MKLTKKEEWILNYLKENSNYANGVAVEYISPTQVGRAYGESMGKRGFHSSSASPSLLKLCEMGLAKRNDKGHYKIKDDDLIKPEKFDWDYFKSFVDSYSPLEHGGNNPKVIFEDMLYGVGVSIDTENHRFMEGYNRFKKFLIRFIDK